MTLADIKNHIFFRTKTTVTQFPAADMVIAINNGLERVESLIRSVISNYNATRFTSSDLSTGTAEPKFHSRFHELIPLWCEYTYAVRENFPNKNDFLNEIQLKEREMMVFYGLRNYKIFAVTIASPGVFTLKKHGFLSGDRVIFETSGALPTGLSAETWYYVISGGLGEDTFEVSSTEDGTAVNTSGTQSGTQFASVDRQRGLRVKNEDNR